MKTIPLTQGKAAIVDDDDYERLSQYKWCAHRYKNTYYARHTVNGSHKSILMHRVILGITDPSIECDHRNKNGVATSKIVAIGKNFKEQPLNIKGYIYSSVMGNG
jgi:hypothetical protein